MDAPSNVLVANLANGCQVFVEWDAPVGTPQGYYVYMCKTSETGTYNKVNFTAVTETKYIIPNLNLDNEVFVKVSAVDENGDETVLSSAGDDAEIASSVPVTLSIEARLNDVISENAYFLATVDGGVIVIQFDSEVTIDGVVTLWELDEDNYVEWTTDHMTIVIDGNTVAEMWQSGFYINGVKVVLDTLGAVVSATDAPYEWDSGGGTIWFIHTDPTDQRMFGVDAYGNLYLPQHDAQDFIQIGAADFYGPSEVDNELQIGNGYYQIVAMDRDLEQLLVRGYIVENSGL